MPCMGVSEFEDRQIATRVQYDYELKNRETSKARLFGINKGQVWLPKSQLMNVSEDNVFIPEWLAKEKGLV